MSYKELLKTAYQTCEPATDLHFSVFSMAAWQKKEKKRKKRNI